MSLKPEVQDSAKLTLEYIELELNMAGIDWRHPLHFMTLATQSDWGPEARTIVLRRFDRKLRHVFFYSHSESPKIAELKKNPKATIVGHHPEQNYQIRLRGTCELTQNNEFAKEKWAKIPLDSRKHYLLRQPPGSWVDFPTSGLAPHLDTGAPAPEESEQGFSKFMVCTLKVEQIDWLYLGEHGHRRCVFIIEADGKTRVQWMIP
jgi:hypothetical protein